MTNDSENGPIKPVWLPDRHFWTRPFLNRTSWGTLLKQELRHMLKITDQSEATKVLLKLPDQSEETL